ncbi:malate dehydrogenase (quinone) [Isoptericola sp. CG 20/1183]|uniref:Probable malate:quinone oxidoreductase n=2 Tax=Isoptericola halotolerans TaxID=300560 RepID=A0ABX5ECJ6_9MICO|nr:MULTISPECIES: malate dehydrogenase (quinone) [Isoptericola]PRZ05115.1 malate dehydrogenase (quinone) [Isoptericola halotolerans]PRZ05853.1 malate dehydrogenase (quinone) [Isoptericola sp. CG 20/1183]
MTTRETASRNGSSDAVDVVLIGGGIMSATLGTLIQQLEPTWSIRIIERLDEVALESSSPWNNAGTGHAALCELNYTPEKADGTIDISKAVAINEQFHTSRELWHHLLATGRLADSSFVSRTPHMTFVRGAKNVDYLRRRHQTLSDHPLFRDLEFSTDRAEIERWAPLLTAERDADEPIAATRSVAGTDVDFGNLTRQLVDGLVAHGAQLQLQHEVRSLKRTRDGGWRLRVKDRSWNAPQRTSTVTARFVFVGAGGGALPLLQSAGIPEIKGFGGFPISGEFLRTDNPEVVAQHQAKVYGKADVGAPPMSVPHLDTRVVDGKSYLMFGPYAGFSPKYLKKGKYLGLVTSLRAHNLTSMIGAGLKNLDLTQYLVGQLVAAPETKFHALQQFMPTAHPKDWETITAGQRVQVIKRDADGKGVLQFGTEIVSAADGSIAGLLGASPGASTAVSAMVDLLGRCFPTEFAGWRPRLAAMMPSLDGMPADAREIDTTTDAASELSATELAAQNGGVLPASVYESRADSRF